MIKKILIMGAMCLTVACFASSPKREFRATWFTTHYAIDWPTTYVTSTGNATQIARQKKEMTDIMDALVEGHMNAFCFQARPTADAFYQSSYEPWSVNLSGTRGLDPGYDPLAYAVEEGHKRGLEVHLWVNPYRVTTSGSPKTTDPVYQNCHDWLIKYDNGSFSGTIIDPGFPQARQYVINVLMEMINNYDVDGILMDDYFYPYGGTTTEDATSKALYKPAGMNDGDWRRSNVDSTMKMLYDTIQAVKPWVRFGMGPFGIWTTQKAVAQRYGISLPVGITGLDDYAVQACNTVEWVKGGYVDYIAPQLYWSTTSTGQCYHTLCKWWAQDVCKHFSDLLPGNQRVDFFVSQAAYRYDETEMGLEIDDNRQFDQLGGPGSVFYNTTSYIKDNGEGTINMHKKIAKTHFTSPALPPAMDWKATVALDTVTQMQLDGCILSWQHPTAQRFTVYAYPKGMNKMLALNNSQYLLGVTYTNSYSLAAVDNLSGKTIAVRAYDRMGNEYDAALYNAGHEVPAYTLTTVSAQPEMGSVSGEGTYMEGETATLTALALNGYEFERWNDNTTDNPRTVRVTSDSIFTAYFRLETFEPQTRGDYTLLQLWGRNVETSGYLMTGNANRSIAYYDGMLYVSDGANSLIHKVDAATGELVRTSEPDNLYHIWHNLCITEDGHLIAGNTHTSAGSLDVYETDVPSSDVLPELTVTFNIADFGRSDYTATYGSWDAHGRLMMLSNVNHKALCIPYNTGVWGTPSIIAHNDLPIGTSARAIPLNDTLFFASASNSRPTLHRMKDGSLADEFGEECPSLTVASGLTWFEMKGRRFIATPVNKYGSFEIYDFTNGLSVATKVMDATRDLGDTEHAAFTVAMTAHVENDTAMIYVLSPDNGIAAFRFTSDTQTGMNLLPMPADEPQKVMRKGKIYIIRDKKIYSPIGLRVE